MENHKTHNTKCSKSLDIMRFIFYRVKIYWIFPQIEFLPSLVHLFAIQAIVLVVRVKGHVDT